MIDIIFPSNDPNKKLHAKFANTLRHHPGNLSEFAPQGNLAYGFEQKNIEPFKMGPSMAAEGGVIFFHNRIKRSDFTALMRILNLDAPWDREYEKKYTTYYKIADNPHQDGYLAQVRIVPALAMRYDYSIITDQEYNNFPSQDLTITEAYWTFISQEKKKYEASLGTSVLRGTFDGDGNNAQEELSFGFMLENSQSHISRIWSRAWLVNK